MAEEMDRPYAGQEGEINDKLLLDLAWERQQKKVRCAPAGRPGPRGRPSVQTVVLAGNSLGRPRACERGARGSAAVPTSWLPLARPASPS